VVTRNQHEAQKQEAFTAIEHTKKIAEGGGRYSRISWSRGECQRFREHV